MAKGINYALLDGNGMKQTVQRGLVDGEGAFFYLMDSGEVRKYRFSRSSELISQQHDDILRLEKHVERLYDFIDTMERRCERLRDKLGKLNAQPGGDGGETGEKDGGQMSFGDGNLHDRVDALESDNANLRELCELLVSRIRAAEAVDGMTWLDARVLKMVNEMGFGDGDD